jgi:hypothetical protein
MKNQEKTLLNEKILKEKFVDIIRFFEYDKDGNVRIWNKILDDICNNVENSNVLKSKTINLINQINSIGKEKFDNLDIEEEIWYLC